MEATKLNIDEERVRGIVVLHLEGDMVGNSTVALKNVIDTMMKEDVKKVVLDLEKVQMIDSSGIGAMVYLLKRVRPAGGDLKIAAVNPQVKHIFHITKLNKALDIFPTVPEAIEGFPSA